MPYAVSMNRESRRIDVCHRGALTFEEILSARTEAAELMRQEPVTRILVDAREADITALSTVEAFQFNTTFADAFNDVWRLRISVIVPRTQHGDWSFFETVARNRGTDLRTFADAAQAHEWLSTGN